jgi:TetR/AcrR family transcriptional regulator, ethionamide resistance regulator
VAVGAEGVRRRRTPAVARAEILDAAQGLLEAGGEPSVAAVMARTEMTRKTFYVHFHDLSALLGELVAPLRTELDAAMARWRSAADPVAAGREALDHAARVYTRHAILLRAVWRVDPETLRAPLVETATALLGPRPNARAIATVLATMNIASLLDGTGDPDALTAVWAAVLLGENPDRSLIVGDTAGHGAGAPIRSRP